MLNIDNMILNFSDWVSNLKNIFELGIDFFKIIIYKKGKKSKKIWKYFNYDLIYNFLHHFFSNLNFIFSSILSKIENNKSVEMDLTST